MNEPSLREELDRLHARVEELEDWSYGLLVGVLAVLPPLLRGHPQVEQAHQVLQKADARYEELLLHPERAEDPQETPARLEPQKMLNRLLGAVGVWPGVDPQELARTAIARRQRGS